ncbi:unnamed protein product [Pedinophyceae sp. YPF-701]|nr:unnamed protein product [Pedinophyceae sp. YPF-701]
MTAWLARLNALVTYALAALAVMSVGAMLSEEWYLRNLKQRPAVRIAVQSFEVFQRNARGVDEVLMQMYLDMDLSPLFHWNTKQLFVFIAAEYWDDDHALQQVVLWDRIATTPEAARLTQPALRHKYRFADRGGGLRGRDFNLTVSWNIMPRVGHLKFGEARVSDLRFPEEYLTRRERVEVGRGGTPSFNSRANRQRLIAGARGVRREEDAGDKDEVIRISEL